jgi:hypothetical protein
MKRLREIIVDDSASEEEDDEDEDLEMAMVMISNKDFRAPRLGSHSAMFVGSTEIEPRAMPRSRGTTSFPMQPIYQDGGGFGCKKYLFLTITRAVEDYDDWFKIWRSASVEISAIPMMKF